MNITLESRACPCCRQENSIHINDCHACGAVLPWVEGTAARASEALARLNEVPSQPSTSVPEASLRFLARPISYFLDRLHAS